MVTLEQLRSELAKTLAEDQNLQYVEVRAETLDAAIADASLQLDTKVANIEYEVIEAGSNGILGLMKRPWCIRAYENAAVVKEKKKKKDTAIFGQTDDMLDEDVIVDSDGVFYVHRFNAQICLKVIPPIGSGTPVDLKEVLLACKHADTLELNEDDIRNFVANGTGGVYEPVGFFEHEQAGDALLSIDISRDWMKASVIVTAPAPGGSEIAPQQIVRALETQGVVAGISNEKIDQFVDMPIYGIPCIVAEALQPIDGRDAYIAYNFETDRSKLKLKEAANGQVDFKELNLIQNVVEGQPLAQKMLPERGKAGKTLDGRYLEAKNGKDIALPLGKNVQVDSDGRTIIASCNGQVLLVNDKITVEPIMEVEAVNIKTGNITFLGTVIVKGNVEDGFNIKASGNIEVYGTVGGCNLEADGDIIVSLGILGRDEAVIKSGKSIWAKFIQNSTVEAEDFIIITDGIMNSQVTCMHKILVQGKRASIIGGHLFATEEIHAKTIGSNGGGSETILEVGFDPRAKRHLEDLIEQQTKMVREIDELELDISTLENMKKVRKSIPHDKEESLKQFIIRRDELLNKNDDVTQEIQEIQQHLRELKVIGKISASGVVYAGVKLYVRDVKEEIRNDVKAVTFFYENGFVRHGKYEPPSAEDMKRAPDGYSTN